MSITTKATIASFGGQLLKLSHQSPTCKCEMSFNLYLPPTATKQSSSSSSSKVPLLVYLAGLTATGDNGAQKGFFQHAASELGIAVLYPDTSPRGLKIQGEDDAYDFGSGAGFYVDATKEPWSEGYKMYTYVTEELPKAVAEAFGEKVDTGRSSIFGHSMGGHGALTLVSHGTNIAFPVLVFSSSSSSPSSSSGTCHAVKRIFEIRGRSQMHSIDQC